MLDPTPFLEVRPAPAWVFSRARDTPHAPRFRIVGASEQVVTWSEFADQIARVASALDKRGVGAGDHVALFGDNSVEWAAAALGIQAAGAVMVPIYASSTAAQASYILDHAEAKVVFVGSLAHLERVVERRPQSLDDIVLVDGEPGCPLEVHEWSTFIGDETPDWNATCARIDNLDLDAPALMLYTSGSTGQPKGVPLTHNNVGKNSRGWLECNREDLHENARDLLWLPMSHIFGLGEMCLGNTLGFETTLCSPKQAIELLARVRPTVFFSVPAYWEKLASLARADADGDGDGRAAARLEELTGGGLRFCLSGGAGLKREVKELFLDAGVLIIEGYGLTECSPTLTLNSRTAYRFDSVGKPLSNVELRLADDGEIQARGPNVFSGYHKASDASREAFTSDGWFRTGDLGRFTDDGFLQIVGRKKEILVTAGGKNIPPANIELRFADDPNIEHLVVYGDGKKFLVAGVWLTEGSNASHDEIARSIDAVNSELPRYESIKAFRIMDEPLSVDAGTLTASLKLRRKHIYDAFGPSFEELYQQPMGRSA